MKKLCIFLVLILVVLNCSCGNTIDMDSILEIDNGSLSHKELALKHKNAISDSPTKQKREDVQTNIKIKINEEEILTDALDYIKEECGNEVIIHTDDSYDPQNKAKNAMPYKPAIFMEQISIPTLFILKNSNGQL